MNQILMGALSMGFLVAGLFFLRFWRETRDRLFGFFALSFFVLGANRAALGLTDEVGDRGDYHYWIRLLAFLLILLAIIDKNRTRKAPPPAP